MYAVERSNGTVARQQGTFVPLNNQTPASDGTRIYFGGSSSEGYVCLDGATGATVWRNYNVFPAESSVALANGYVYATTNGGTLVALNAATGTQVDSKTLDVTGGTSSPAVYN